jgi:methanogenic corrinoid protein MtbC1
MRARRPFSSGQGHPVGHDSFREYLALVLEHHVPAILEESYRDSGMHRQLGDGSQQRPMSRTEIEELTDAFLVSEPGAFIEVLERQGLSKLTFAAFYRSVVSPIAAALGDMWCDDRAGFLAVSIATERLRLAVDTLYSDHDVVGRHARRSALITCYDNSQHTFGAFLLAKAFVFADWLVETREWNDPSGSPIGLVSRSPFDFIGLSMGATDSAAACAKVVSTLRTKSMNPDIVIGVGGPGPALNPEGYARCGADFVSSDAIDAVLKADEAVARNAR